MSSRVSPDDSLKNLKPPIAGETYEVTEMYPSYMKLIEFQEEKSAYRSFQWSYETEKMHKALFEKAKKAVEKRYDVELGAVLVYEVCGLPAGRRGAR